jgi:hypothetical protein
LNQRLQAWLWLGAFSLTGIALALLYPDSYQQDGGHHYLFARYAWTHPEMFVGVWSRPLFTFVYAFPALLGYAAAKLFTVLICLATAWQTFRIAEELGIKRAALTIPMLFLQPSYFLLSADTMTEPLCALVLAIALRLHLKGRIVAGMIVASLMVLARPEGFFLGVLWGTWVLLDKRGSPNRWRRLPGTLLLATGAAVWWLAALLITGDPLFIKNNWPPDWAEAAYGTGSIFTYFVRMPEIAGPLLAPVFLFGLVLLVARRQLRTVTSVFLTIFILHSLFRSVGLFGAAGYPRYFVCVAPVIALIMLAGWNETASWLTRAPRVLVRAGAVTVLSLSVIFSVSYADAAIYVRDARAIKEMHAWFRENPKPIEKVVWSQAYMCIRFDCDIWEKPSFTTDKEANLKLVQQFPAKTLIFWDGDTGPSWYNLKADDFERAGFTRLRSQSYQLEGLLVKRWWFHDWGPRAQEMHLLYKHPEGVQGK